MAKTPKTVHQLKVTLRDVEPPVWRRVIVPSDTKLSTLAPILLDAMGWHNEHLHLFEVDGKQFGEPDPDWDVLDERGRKLVTVLPDVGATMRFDYDFGDGWEHDVVVEAIEPAERGGIYPRLIDGKRACPPEDCGGPLGYRNLLEAVADPAHPDHENAKEWLGDDFDPERFDLPGTSGQFRK